MVRVPNVLILILVLRCMLVSLDAAAQGAQKIYRIGHVTPYSLAEDADGLRVFEETLHQLGYAKGQNISLLYRSTEGRDEKIPEVIAELLGLKIDVLVTHGTPDTRVAQRATSTVPIVMLTVLDPVGAGFVASLSRPGGNITGSSELSEELIPKRLELIKEILPNASLIGVLYDPTHPANLPDLKRTEAAAKALGLMVRAAPAHELAEIDRAFAEMKRGRPDALVVLVSYSAFTHVAHIAGAARDIKLPTIYGDRDGARAGALISYGPDPIDQYRHAAAFVDKILKGAKPSDLPVEQPTRFDLAINLKTAKALGLTLPESILVRANLLIK